MCLIQNVFSMQICPMLLKSQDNQDNGNASYCVLLLNIYSFLVNNQDVSLQEIRKKKMDGFCLGC
jgi:hypothetical protein